MAQRTARLEAGDRALVNRVVAGLGDFNRAMSASAPGAQLLELAGGVVAAVIPSVPERSLMNAVVYQGEQALVGALGELTAAYGDAGVLAWMVTVPATDGEVRRLVKRAGHVLTGIPTAMARELPGVERPSNGALDDWTDSGDAPTMAAICDQAFLFGDGFERTFTGPLPDWAHVYLARVDGEPAACVLSLERDGNCAIGPVATLPRARGRGLGGALLAHALADAGERGCVTTTLAATPEGRPGFERLGYRPLCAIQQWERRREAG
jgi:GNAT superfamily N-acetyltransferase